jgi:hypothetical protein
MERRKDYGHSILWESLQFKVSGTHAYVAMGWKEGDEMEYADMASADGGKTWEMQNDSNGGLTVAQWRKSRCKPDCDWLEIPGEEE